MTAPRKEILAEGVECWLGDMLEILPTLGEFDACVTDPPYGIGVDRAMESNSGTQYGRAAAPKGMYVASGWDDAAPTSAAFDAMRSCSRYQVFFGGNYFDLPPSRCWLIWDKKNGGNAFADCEMAWTNLDKPVRRIEWMWNGMLRKGGEGRNGHPTQKPLGVMEWVLDQLPEDAATILDPYMGSGTTGVAAIKRRKAFYGIEREPAYFDIACRRISAALKQPDLFIEPAKPTAAQEALPL